MTGKYDIEIYNKRVHYHLTVKRNITVIQGDSATGKTEDIKNCFSVKVKAAEVQKLERGKETAVITQKELGSGGWSGTDSTKEISYVIESHS